MSKSKKEKPKVVVPGALRDAVAARMDDLAAREELPTLLDVLLPVYDAGKLVRQAGKLSVKPEGPRWIVTIDCPTEVLTARIACESLAGMLAHVEACLVAGHVIWSPGWSRQKKALPVLDDLIQ